MVIVLGVLAVLGVWLVRTVDDHVLSQVDQNLTSSAQWYEYAAEHREHLPASLPAGQFGQMYTHTGQMLGQSANMVGRPPLVHFLPPGVRTPTLITTNEPKLGALRVLEYPFGGNSRLVLIEGQQISQAIAASDSLSHLLFVLWPLLAIALGFLIWHVVGKSMRRVETIRSSVAHISTNDLNERVPTTGRSDELDRLATTMNEMLDRLETAVARERQFVSDASHELQSPIAALKAALASPSNDPFDARARLASAASSLQRLELLADELLTLEAGSPASAAPLQAIDVDDLVLSEAAHLRSHSRLNVSVSEVSSGQVLAREMDLARVIENLASNAARHAKDEVRFSLREEGGMVRLSVMDNGPGVPEELREQVFERFYRADSDRNRNGGGNGLGLAIVRELVERSGGSVFVETGESGGAKFVVELPAALRIGEETRITTSSLLSKAEYVRA
jgi:signal transduction histidine kinase